MSDGYNRLKRFCITYTDADRDLLKELAILIEQTSIAQVYRTAIWALHAIVKHRRDGYTQLFVVRPKSKKSREIKWKQIF